MPRWCFSCGVFVMTPHPSTTPLAVSVEVIASRYFPMAHVETANVSEYFDGWATTIRASVHVYKPVKGIRFIALVFTAMARRPMPL